MTCAPGITTRGGIFQTNGDREQEYTGASVTFNKRLANRWMLRGNFSWQDWTWDVPDTENEDRTPLLGGGINDDDPVLQGSGTGSGSKGGVYINSKWSYSVNGLYQVAPDRPWGFNLAGNLTGREGYPIPYFTAYQPRVDSRAPPTSRSPVIRTSSASTTSTSSTPASRRSSPSPTSG